MKEFNTTVSQHGRITVPLEVRRHLGMRDRQWLTFVIDDEGSVRLQVARYPTIDSLRGVAGSLTHALSDKDMIEVAYEDRAQEGGLP